MNKIHIKNLHVGKRELIAVCIAIVVAFMFAVTLFVPRYSAHADSSSGGLDTSSPIHYFSDYEGSADIAASIRQTLGRNINRYYIAGNNHSEIVNNLDAMKGMFDNITNSYIIFEIRTMFPAMKVNGATRIMPDVLKEVFSKLKKNGCRIMFICGTLESRFIRHNAFLDYVDIHLNIDKMSDFLLNVMLYPMRDGSYRWDNCTFLVDKNFGFNSDFGFAYDTFTAQTAFFRFAFIPVFISLYGRGTDEAHVVREMLLNNVKLLCHRGGTIFYDVVYGVDRDISNLEDLEYFINERVYAVGTSKGGEIYTNDWMDVVADFAENNDQYLQYFMMDTAGVLPYDWRNYEVYRSYEVADTDIKPIIIDFLRGRDLTHYDNCNGRCIITHRFVTTGSGGWMIDLLGVEFEDSLSYIQLFITEDDEVDYEVLYGDCTFGEGLIEKGMFPVV